MIQMTNILKIKVALTLCENYKHKLFSLTISL